MVEYARKMLLGTYPLVVDNLNNGGKLSFVHAFREEDHTANFDLSPRGGDYVCLAHSVLL